MYTHPTAKMDLKVKASGRSQTHYGLELSRLLTPRSLFVYVSPCPSLRRDFTSLCVCRYYFLEVLTRNKDWLLTLFLLSLLFLRANGGLIVNSSTGAHLSLISGNAKRRLADCKCPTLEPICLLPQKIA